MKKLNFFLLPFFLFFQLFQGYSHGVAIVDAYEGVYLHLLQTDVEVNVNNQVAIVKTTQVFRNVTGGPQLIKYGFPMHVGASAINLRWFANGRWRTAEVTTDPQDNTLPGTGGEGSSIVPGLAEFLAGTPLLFSPDDTIGVDSLITVELTYVELLPYAFNNVNFHYPNRYHLIQPFMVENEQTFNFHLHSDRTILDLQFLSHSGQVENNGNVASVSYSVYETLADTDYEISYELSSEELGVFDMSTFLPDSLNICDTHGNGFVSLVIEPESNVNTEVIEKNFTLIVDRSGSMSGDKIVQAREAAKFIVNNLNYGDYFNIIDFSAEVESLHDAHIEYTNTTRNEALDYISGFTANGGTNIAGALSTAINQFSVVDPNKANIIIFFTDGRATVGQTQTSEILSLVSNEVTATETEIFLFTFGIGQDGVDKQLLTLLALENNGIVEILGDDELQEKITAFFLKINNPVLLGTQLEINPNIIHEIYPDPLPNLYKGQQLILAGRYFEPQPVTITVSGKAFNTPVSYDYQINLADTLLPEFQFLPKLWAKRKIDDLTFDYYSLPSTDPLAEAINQEIEDISVCYQVISDFTSFTNPDDQDPGGDTTAEFEIAPAGKIVKMEAYPNPFSDYLHLKLEIPVDLYEDIVIYIYDDSGKLVKSFEIFIGPAGWYEINWNGMDQNGKRISNGQYFCVVKIGERLGTMKVVKIN